jgi:hypothetical protein
MFYNFARPHGSLGKNVTRAITAGISDHVWTVYEVGSTSSARCA